VLNLKRSLIHQPILDDREIQNCIQQGHRWTDFDFEWSPQNRQAGQSGSFIAQQFGSGIDFTETREYQHGDQLRHINWRAMARIGRPQVRVFHEDVAPVSCFLIDRRASMRFGTKKRLKVTQAVRLAIFLSAWELGSGAELGALILNETARWIDPAGGENGLNQLVQAMTQACPPMKSNAEIKLSQSLSQLATLLPAGSNLYLLSDFHDLETDCLPQLYRLGRQHRVWAIDIHDPAEQSLPIAGRLKLIWNPSENAQKSSLIDTTKTAIQEQQKLRFV
jgi:uncharacterized protein (DUF58 family)